MSDRTENVFKVRDLFDSPLNIKTDTKIRWSEPREIFKAMAHHPKTSMLNTRRKTDGSLARSGFSKKRHTSLNDAVIHECDLVQWIAEDRRTRIHGIDSLETLQAQALKNGKPIVPYTIAVDGDGVAKRVNGELIIVTKALPFDERQTKQPRKESPAKAAAQVLTEDPNKLKAEIASLEAQVEDLQDQIEDLRSAPVQANKWRTLLQRIWGMIA